MPSMRFLDETRRAFLIPIDGCDLRDMSAICIRSCVQRQREPLEHHAEWQKLANKTKKIIRRQSPCPKLVVPTLMAADDD